MKHLHNTIHFPWNPEDTIYSISLSQKRALYFLENYIIWAGPRIRRVVVLGLRWTIMCPIQSCGCWPRTTSCESICVLLDCTCRVHVHFVSEEGRNLSCNCFAAVTLWPDKSLTDYSGFHHSRRATAGNSWGSCSPSPVSQG